jgi:Ca-activated chloride channel family protein
MWRFEDPWLLCLALAIPLWILFELKGRRGAALLFSSLTNVKAMRQRGAVASRRLLLVLRALALMFLVLAAARPQSGQSSTEILSQGIDIILCVDTSGSMRAMDFEIDGQRVDRLRVAKDVVARFVKGRKNDRIGMVVFAGQAYTQCPLTLDYGVLAGFLDHVQIGMAGDGTAIGSALGTSVKRLRDSEAKSKVVVLLTDGRNNAGKIDPETAAKIAEQYRIKVYTIGAGTRGAAPFLVDGFFGKQYVYQNVDLDEEALKKVAEITGGEYFRATDTEGLEEIYKRIDEMEKTEVKVKEYEEYTELFPRFLIPGLVFVGLEIMLGNTWLRKIP